MASILAINGTVVNRSAARIVLNRLTLSMDGPGSLEMTERATKTPGTYRQGQLVTLTIDGTLRFSGVIVSLHPSGIGSGPIDVGYRCLDLTWLANQIPITASDGTGRMTFNLPSTDDDYIPSLSGLSVGAILKRIYDGHATQLTAAGITGGYSPTELAALTVVPPEPVIVTGRLWNAVIELLSQWHNKYGAWIDASGVIHHPNLLTLTTSTLTLDSDPVTLGSVSEDFSECYTQAVLRGGAWIEAAYLSLADGMLAARWTAAQQTAWTYADFVQPKGAYELGTIGSMTSTTLSVTATSPASISYGSNYWSPLNAEVVAYTTSGSAVAQIGFCETRRITTSTAPSSNSYTLTVDTAFNNSGYSKYSIRGLAAAQSLVWRAFDLVPTYVSQHLVKRFSHSVPWSPTDGGVVQTTSPQALVCFTQAGIPIEWPMTFQIVPSDGAVACTTIATATATTSAGAVTGFTSLSGGAGYRPSSSSIPVTISGGGGSGALAHAVSNGSGVITSVVLDAGGSGYTSAPRVTIGSSPGYIVFDQPICAAYSSAAAMQAGGSAISAPTDIKVLVPYSRGAISVQAPSGGGYSGTAYTVNGVQRTLYIDYPQWLDYRDTTAYQTLANEKLDTVKNTVIEGTITYWGKLSTALTLGSALNIAGNGYATGYESIAAPIRGVVLDYAPDGGPSPWVMQLSFSTRLKPFSGDRLYAHPSWGSGGMAGGLSVLVPPSWGSGGSAAALPPAMGDLGGFEAPADFEGDPFGDGRTGENHYRRPRPMTAEQRRERGQRHRDQEAARHHKPAVESHDDPAGREMHRLAIQGVTHRQRPAAEQSEANTQAMLDQIEKGSAPIRQRDIDRDQAESARRAREHERRAIKARNAAKTDRGKDASIDEYLRDHEFRDGSS